MVGEPLGELEVDNDEEYDMEERVDGEEEEPEPAETEDVLWDEEDDIEE